MHAYTTERDGLYFMINVLKIMQYSIADVIAAIKFHHHDKVVI